MSKSANFVNRTSSRDDNVDYIALANDQLKKNNGEIDPTEPIYLNALEQYNEGLSKGSVERLDVPKGFCGYVDEASGEFRVEPEIDPDLLARGEAIPDLAEPDPNVISLSAQPYPIDQCLQIGLPGSPTYTEANCGVDDGDTKASGIDWASYTIAGLVGIGSDEFLWKPISESDGNLVILLPSKYRGLGESQTCTILKNGNPIASGTFAGAEHNGFRPHFRFDSPGASYGKNLIVEATILGGKDQWGIPDGAVRTTY